MPRLMQKIIKILMPYVFKALRLFFLANFPGPTFIPCPTSIPDSRVVIQFTQHYMIYWFHLFRNL